MTLMQSHVQQIVFWSGTTQDICNYEPIVRSAIAIQPSMPQKVSDPPTSHFENIFADIFQFAGNNFLIEGDRLSGWSEICSTAGGISHVGSRELIKCLRILFSKFEGF